MDVTKNGSTAATNQAIIPQVVQLKGDAGGKRFDGIGIVNGGGATSVLLKDYPEPQRSQILDLVFKPKFGASVSALLVEIPGDGNATQGSMPSHMHARDDLHYGRGYTWWIMREARKRNPNLSLDGAAWSAPGWIGQGEGWAEDEFWSQDAADYYLKWLEGLRDVYGLELDALGCRNEKGVSLEFVKRLRSTLDAGGFPNVEIHAFDNWPDWKFDFVPQMLADEEAQNAIGIIGAHVMYAKPDAHASQEVQEMATQMGKPIWNTEDHVYLKGFDCAISIVECFNENFIHSGATRVVNWYDIAGVYSLEPYSEDPAMILAHSPWNGHYVVRESLWGYAHYGQFTQVGWRYLDGGCGVLAQGGSFVTLQAPDDNYSIVIETKGATAPQQLRFQVGGGLSETELCVWRSNAREQFVRQASIMPHHGAFVLAVEPDSIYSLSTTTGQQKGVFEDIPTFQPFPFPYYETFEEYAAPAERGYLPRYTADIAGAFELVDRPDGAGKCLRQVVPRPTISWAPDWRPYTILGDEAWQNYEVGADVYLNPGDCAGVMGRVNHVGTGYGFIPKGYFLRLGDDGQCQLVVVRGKEDKNRLVGDAEQQALIKEGQDEGEGGELVLGAVQLPDIRPGQWHNLKMRFDGSNIAAWVDGQPVLSATHTLYSRGMVGLMAGQEEQRTSTPYFDNVLIKGLDAPTPKPSSAASRQWPLYQ